LRFEEVTNCCSTLGGSQFKIVVNDIIMVNKLPAQVGSKIKLEKVRKLSHNKPLKMRYSPYVNKGFVYISVSKILNFIRQLFIFSWF
jgi:ribosomal protein L21